MVKSNSTYEELRLERLEENKKRMEELNINKLSHDLHKSTDKQAMKSRTPRPRQSLNLTAVKRSSRVANNPPLNYSEALIEPLKIHRRRSYQRRDLLSRVYASDDSRRYAIERAEEVRSALKTDSPTFIKPMLQSHVTRGFWLGLPQHFCTSHLPGYDEIITLVDEEDNEFPTKYLAHKHGLSAGWRGFAIDHQLLDGDALVFQLLTPKQFKVYICRTSINDIGTIEDFTILVDGFCIDSIIPDHQKTKYYKLCCSQNSLLHKNLLKSLNHLLFAEIIIQTVNISDAIRDSDITTSKADFKLWDTLLKGFGVLGMNVGFMRAHLSKLMNHLAYSEEPVEWGKHRELVEKQMQVKENIKKRELELLELKDEDGKLDVEVETARVNIDMYRSMFQEEVDASWTMV